MYGCKDKLCLDAEVTLVTSRHPKMLAAYTHKLHPLAEKKMVETGQHQILKSIGLNWKKKTRFYWY